MVSSNFCQDEYWAKKMLDNTFSVSVEWHRNITCSLKLYVLQQFLLNYSAAEKIFDCMTIK